MKFSIGLEIFLEQTSELKGSSKIDQLVPLISTASKKYN